jgi:hypothetical protein
LDDGGKRMEYYHQVLDRAIAATKQASRKMDANGKSPTSLPRTDCQKPIAPCCSQPC